MKQLDTVKIACLPEATRLLSISTFFFRINGFWVLQLSIANSQERESEQIMNLLLAETNFKARSIAQYIFGTCMLNV